MLREPCLAAGEDWREERTSICRLLSSCPSRLAAQRTGGMVAPRRICPGFPASVLFAVALLALTLIAACDGGDEGDIGRTTPATTATPATEATASEATMTPANDATAGETTGASTSTEEAPTPDDSLMLPLEAGEDPIYWRTLDEFQSVRAGEPYKVILRLANGYDEETLRIVAEQEPNDGGTAEFEARRVQAAGPEEPGSYYAFNLELPQPGTWEMTVVAGDDRAVVTVQVSPSG